jgi:Fibronectin type III domain
MKTSNADPYSLENASGRGRVSRTKSLMVGLASAIAVVGGVAGLAIAGVSPAGASTVDAVATIAAPNGLTSLSSGGSTTQFTINLPASAACSGDTATHGNHVFSYLVPKGTDPKAVSFLTGFPSADHGLFDANGNYYGKDNTALTTGQIISIPTNLEFAPLLSRGVTAASLEANGGVWQAGIACANSSGVVTDYWNTQVTFAASGSDPNGFVWSDTPGGPPSIVAVPTATTGHASATVDWTAPAGNGGSAVNGYVITPHVGATAKTPINVGNVTSDVVTGLTPGTPYTFTVAATNSVGTGATSSASNSVTPTANVPGAPTVGTVKAGHGSAALKWTGPSNNGGAAISGYVITAYIGKTAKKTVHVGNVTSDTVTGLVNGTAYTLNVAATNSAGTGAGSAHSASVTPNGLYITTKSLPKATKGKKYATVHLAEKNGVGTETWKADGLPSGITLNSAGVLSGTEKGGAKTYSVTVAVRDSSKPTKQTATAKFSLVVAN